MASNDMLSKLLSSNSFNHENNNQQLQQLYSLFAANNGTKIGNTGGNTQTILPIHEIINNLSNLIEQFFGSKYFIFSIVIIVFGILFFCSFCFMIYCCFHTKWCRKFEKNDENKFKLFN